MASTTVHPPTNPKPPLLDQIQGVIRPGLLIVKAIQGSISVFIEQPTLLFRDVQLFRHAAFSKVWNAIGAAMSVEMPGNTIANLGTVSGHILDLGPGTGVLLKHFDSDKITGGYGPEPAVDMHSKLQHHINKAGLQDKYHILACGAEPNSLVPALAKAGAIKTDGSGSTEVFDTIVCTRVLCGVPSMDETVAQLYRLLKPGGRMIISEHISSPYPESGSLLGWMGQTMLWAFGWNFWMGGCTINRDTVGAFRKAGKWSSFDLTYVDPWSAVPFVVGTLVK